MKTVLTAAALAMTMGVAMPVAMASGDSANNTEMSTSDRQAYESRAHDMIMERDHEMEEMAEDVSDTAKEAWAGVKESWNELTEAADENWEDAKSAFSQNWKEFEHEWDEMTSDKS